MRLIDSTNIYIYIIIIIFFLKWFLNSNIFKYYQQIIK